MLITGMTDSRKRDRVMPSKSRAKSHEELFPEGDYEADLADRSRVEVYEELSTIVSPRGWVLKRR